MRKRMMTALAGGLLAALVMAGGELRTDAVQVEAIELVAYEMYYADGDYFYDQYGNGFPDDGNYYYHPDGYYVYCDGDYCYHDDGTYQAEPEQGGQEGASWR